MKDLNNTHNQFSYSSLKPITLSIALLSVGFTVFNYLLLDGSEKYIIMSLTALSAVFFFNFTFCLKGA